MFIRELIIDKKIHIVITRAVSTLKKAVTKHIHGDCIVIECAIRIDVLSNSTINFSRGYERNLSINSTTLIKPFAMEIFKSKFLKAKLSPG